MGECASWGKHVRGKECGGASLHESGQRVMNSYVEHECLSRETAINLIKSLGLTWDDEDLGSSGGYSWTIKGVEVARWSALDHRLTLYMEIPSHGGKRTGAGRPVGAKSKTTIDPRFRRDRLGVRLPQWMIKWLRHHPQKPGQLIELALVNHFSLKAPK